jgi:hypothetical protein
VIFYRQIASLADGNSAIPVNSSTMAEKLFERKSVLAFHLEFPATANRGFVIFVPAA